MIINYSLFKIIIFLKIELNRRLELHSHLYMFQRLLPSDQDSSFEFRKNLEKGLVLSRELSILTFGSLIDI